MPAAKLGCTEAGDASFLPIAPQQELAPGLFRPVGGCSRVGCHGTGSRQASPPPPAFRTEPCWGVGSVSPLSPFPRFRAAPLVLSWEWGAALGPGMGSEGQDPPYHLFWSVRSHPHFAEGRTLGHGSLQLSCQPLEAPEASRSPRGCPGSDPSKLPAFVLLKLFGGSRVLLCLQLSVYLEKDNAIVGEDNENIKYLKFSVSHYFD